MDAGAVAEKLSISNTKSGIGFELQGIWNRDFSRGDGASSLFMHERSCATEVAAPLIVR
jgi:hypothetical protein